MTTADDLERLRVAIALARQARARGNLPFGAVLFDPDGHLLDEAENTQVTSRDLTAHAEANLMRGLSGRFPADLLARATLYASTEPCAMCAGAIFWGGVGRVVFALGSDALKRLAGPGQAILGLPCREVFAHAGRPVIVEGPSLEDEAAAVFEGFWA